MAKAKGDKRGIYQDETGEYWLDYDRGRDGAPTSKNFYIWWYDPSTGHQRRKSTRTSDLRLALIKLKKHVLDTRPPDDETPAHDDVRQAINDYYVEHGSEQISSDSIHARLKLVHRFLNHEISEGRLVEPIRPQQVTPHFIKRMRAWINEQPIVARKKDAEGNFVEGMKWPRSAATTEECIGQFRAALSHAYKNGGITYMPPIEKLPRSKVSQPRTDRLSVSGIAEVLDYALRGKEGVPGHAARLMPLRRYAIAAICTLARPDAILDMSVKPDRRQWMKEDGLFALNPAGRQQTKKHRPVVPVNRLLHEWLCATQEWVICNERIDTHPKTGAAVIKQSGVSSIRHAWDTMRDELGLPKKWGPKLLRHSMATELRRRRVDPWELQGYMGHRSLGTTEIYAIYDPDYLGSVTAAINDIISELAKINADALLPGAPHAIGIKSRAAILSPVHPNFTRVSR